MKRVAANAAVATSAVAIVTGCVTRSATVEISPLGSAATTNHTDLRTARRRAVRGDLSGDQDPQQADGDHEERDEGLAQTFTELADRREAAELVDERNDRDDEGQVTDHQ
jgi:hypothetical protein